MGRRLCSIDGCGRPHVARGLCHRHWQAAKADGILEQHQPVGHLVGPGALAAHVADLWGVYPHELLTRDGPADARLDLIHRLHVELDFGPSAIARLLGFRSSSSIHHALIKQQPTPPADVTPKPETDACSVPGCNRGVDGHGGMRMCSGHRMRWQRHGDVRPDRPLRPIRADDAPVLDLEVHDRRGYRNGCRCDDCRADAVRAVKRNRHRPQSMPPDRGARAVRRLVDAGMTVPEIAAAAGVANATLYKWLRDETSTCFRSTVEKVEAVRPGPAGTVEALRAPTCAEDNCTVESFAGGRWCWDHYQANRRAGAA